MLIKNGFLIDPVKETAEKKNLAVKDGKILSFTATEAHEVIDVEGGFVSCGFIESHLHLEGLHLLPEHYYNAFFAHGTTTVVTDLHEIGNAGGIAGLKWYLSLIDRVPLDVYVMAPSCVPSSRFELGAGRIGTRELARLKTLPQVIGLGEVMDLEGVMLRRKAVMKKLGLFERRPVDGHAPGVIGDALDLYMSAGIYSDHEVTARAEGEEKLRRGMHLFLRQGSVSKDLPALLPLIRPQNLGLLSLCTDDLNARDLYTSGHLDRLLGYLISTGIPPFRALRLVTVNPALYFNLSDRSRLGVGRKADLVVFDDPEKIEIKMTIKSGRVVYKKGKNFPTSKTSPGNASNKLNTGDFTVEMLRQKARGAKIRMIGVKEGSIFAEDLSTEACVRNGYLASDTSRDIALAYVFDRYRGDQTFGFGFVHGFSVRSGAIGSTYAHDSHNLIVVGENVEDIFRVFCMLRKCGGGMAACCNGEDAVLRMPYYGIISDLDPSSFLKKETQLARLVNKMGISLKNPFFQMSFLSLPVIPQLRLTTKGLFHVTTSAYVPTNHD